ncbi:hypothetical protein GGE08_000486 [Muricauda sp. ARW1Y1]|nr:hypothetical protein [Muricauda sp. ARW1Y1]
MCASIRIATNIVKNGGVQNKPDNFLLTFEKLYFVDNFDAQIK